MVLPAQRLVEDGRFASSPRCAECHSNAPSAAAMRDAQGQAVAPFDLWQATMMANASRDPLFRAQLSVELVATPALASALPQKCLTCHAPMATTLAAASGSPLALDELEQDTTRAQLALDGISCTFCHAIQPPSQVSSTFSGAHALGPPGQLFGPHTAPFAGPMVNRSGFTPVAATHLRSSSLCAGCHTLTTDAHDANGIPTGGRLPEQTPYLEWQNSVFNDELAAPSAEAASCQACHVPTTDGLGAPVSTAIARTPAGRDFGSLGPRDPFGRHLYVGGNTLIPAILRDARAELSPQAPDAAFDEVIAQTRDQLQRRTADVRISLQRAGDRLLADVSVEHRVGHKFPTGHPVRRAWLRVEVTDAAGRRVFASGAYDAEGRLIDDAGAPLPSELAGGPLQPHHTRIASPDQVQIYQSVMADAAGTPTWVLLRGERFLKDNRLLPKGWSRLHANAGVTAAAGAAAGDPDHTGGGDTTRYEVQAPLAAGPYRVEVRLLYQPLGARYANELFAFNTREVQAFRAMYQRADKVPTEVARASASAP